MGMDVYKVTFEQTGIPRNYEFYDRVLEYFRLDDGTICINTDQWDEFLESHPLVAQKYPEEIAEVKKLLKESEGFVELQIA